MTSSSFSSSSSSSSYTSSYQSSCLAAPPISPTSALQHFSTSALQHSPLRHVTDNFQQLLGSCPATSGNCRAAAKALPRCCQGATRALPGRYQRAARALPRRYLPMPRRCLPLQKRMPAASKESPRKRGATHHCLCRHLLCQNLDLACFGGQLPLVLLQFLLRVFNALL